MNFFQELIAITGEVDVTIRLKSKNGKITVGILPAVSSTLPMLDVTGTAQELDEGLMEQIRLPLTQASGLVSNAESFKEQVKDVEKLTESKATTKDKAKSTAPEKPKGGKKEKSGKAEKPEKKSIPPADDDQQKEEVVDDEPNGEESISEPEGSIPLAIADDLEPDAGEASNEESTPQEPKEPVEQTLF
ncbi:MAG: PRTRC system protein E [Taibaiella sp.]|jgi:PRTRC genetic system protein E